MVNTTAVELGLGTGGWHVVHWNLARDASGASPGPGHIMKLRYTSLQADTGAAEEHRRDAARPTLDGAPVVACSLHSQVPGVAAAVQARSARRPGRLRDDRRRRAAAGPLRPRRRPCADAGLVAATVTAGHAFGGDLEAVSVPSALALARHAARRRRGRRRHGPGRGRHRHRARAHRARGGGASSTPRPRSAAGPSLALRVSDADPRDRHQGVSHHTRTVLDARPVAPVARARCHPGGSTRRSATRTRSQPSTPPTSPALLDGRRPAGHHHGPRTRRGPALLRRRRAPPGAAGRAALSIRDGLTMAIDSSSAC